MFSLAPIFQTSFRRKWEAGFTMQSISRGKKKCILQRVVKVEQALLMIVSLSGGNSNRSSCYAWVRPLGGCCWPRVSSESRSMQLKENQAPECFGLQAWHIPIPSHPFFWSSTSWKNAHKIASWSDNWAKNSSAKWLLRKVHLEACKWWGDVEKHYFWRWM